MVERYVELRGGLYNCMRGKVAKITYLRSSHILEFLSITLRSVNIALPLNIPKSCSFAITTTLKQREGTVHILEHFVEAAKYLTHKDN